MLIGDTLSVKNERKLVLRHDGRQPHDLRDLKISRNFLSTAEGSVLIEIEERKCFVLQVLRSLCLDF